MVFQCKHCADHMLGGTSLYNKTTWVWCAVWQYHWVWGSGGSPEPTGYTRWMLRCVYMPHIVLNRNIPSELEDFFNVIPSKRELCMCNLDITLKCIAAFTVFSGSYLETAFTFRKW